MDREYADDTTTSKRIAKQKAEAIQLLGKMPNISGVCAKIGISRSSFHRWMAEDELFRDDVNKALRLGKSLINDKAFNNVVTSVEQRDPAMTRFWLTHEHPDFSNKLILEPWELENIKKNKDYMGLAILGRLSAGAARIFESYFLHRNKEKKLSLLRKVLGE